MSQKSQNALRIRAGRLERALKEIIFLAQDVEFQRRTAESAAYEIYHTAAKALGQYRPAGMDDNAKS